MKKRKGKIRAVSSGYDRLTSTNQYMEIKLGFTYNFNSDKEYCLTCSGEKELGDHLLLHITSCVHHGKQLVKSYIVKIIILTDASLALNNTCAFNSLPHIHLDMVRIFREEMKLAGKWIYFTVCL